MGPNNSNSTLRFSPDRPIKELGKKMKQISPMENKTEALAHVRFQMDLLRMTAMPIAMSGPSVMREVEVEREAMRVMEELTSTVAVISRR